MHMTDGIELIERDKNLQRHWLLRVAAYLVDWLLIWTPFWVIFLMLGQASFSLVAGGIMVLYCAFFEVSSGETIGKKLLGLRTVSNHGSMDNQKAFLRNISKVFPVLALIDVIIGLATTGDPRQKYTDRLAYTTVIEKQHLKPE